MTTKTTAQTTEQMDFFAQLGNQSFDDVKNLGGEAKYPDLFMCQVKQAVLNQSENGVITLDIAINLCDPETREPQKTLNLDTFFITGKDGEQRDQHKSALKKINNLRYLLNPSMPEKTIWGRGIMPAKMWDKDEKKFIEDKPTMQLTDIVGKFFWGIVVNNQKYPQIMVNGYSRIPITAYNVDPVANEAERKDPETIYVPDYSQKHVPSFSLWGFYDIDKKQSLSERMEGKAPEEITKTLETALEKAEKGEFKEAEATEKEEKASRKKALQNKLKDKFNQERWDSSNSAVASAYNATSSLF